MSDLRPWRTITYSCADSPETRKQVLQHDSVYDSLKSGRRVINQDTCKEAPKPAKTS